MRHRKRFIRGSFSYKNLLDQVIEQINQETEDYVPGLSQRSVKDNIQKIAFNTALVYFTKFSESELLSIAKSHPSLQRQLTQQRMPFMNSGMGLAWALAEAFTNLALRDIDLDLSGFMPDPRKPPRSRSVSKDQFWSYVSSLNRDPELIANTVPSHLMGSFAEMFRTLANKLDGTFADSGLSRWGDDLTMDASYAAVLKGQKYYSSLLKALNSLQSGKVDPFLRQLDPVDGEDVMSILNDLTETD